MSNSPVLGQYIDYEAALAESSEDKDRILYIALPDIAYTKIKSIRFFIDRIKDHSLKFLTIDLEHETIEEWKN